MERLPTTAEVEKDIRLAAESGSTALGLRRRLRRRTKPNNPDRQEELLAAIDDLTRHGHTLRSHLKRSDYHDRPYTTSLRRKIKRLLAQLRYERRQLTKMFPQT